jgi:dTDP-4-dehydrorhamnose 3,5-epimerase
LKWISIELSSDNRLQLFVPKGFAHGFLTLTDNVLFHYKVDAHYNKNSEITVRYDDPLLSINWGTIDPILSEKDLTAPTLEQSKCNYIFNF